MTFVLHEQLYICIFSYLGLLLADQKGNGLLFHEEAVEWDSRDKLCGHKAEVEELCLLAKKRHLHKLHILAPNNGKEHIAL